MDFGRSFALPILLLRVILKRATHGQNAFLLIISGTYKPNLNTYPTMDAVFVFAYALKAVHEDVCAGRVGVCAEMEKISGQQLMGYMKNVTFTGKSLRSILCSSFRD